jgi:hypothetical protein
MNFLKSPIQALLGLVGYQLTKLHKKAPPSFYDQDGLRTYHNHDFLKDPAFCKAYARGCLAAADDYRWHWRVHVGLWAAHAAKSIPGDFVECGVNRGFMSSAIMDYLTWDSLGKQFYLLDTFQGLDKEQISGHSDKRAANETFLKSGFYTTNVEAVKQNFAEWKNHKIIAGTVPATLGEIHSEAIAFLHLDMNCAPPEVAALEYLWDRLSPGAVILLDDYAQIPFIAQKRALDVVTASKGVQILSLPTGQGLFLKPAARQSA